MTANNKPDPAPNDEGHVVYRRAGGGEAAVQRGPQRDGRDGSAPPLVRLAPALTPLILGFTLLLILIFILGYFGVRKIEDTSRQVFDMGSAHTSALKLLLQLRDAVTALNTEARVRDAAITRDAIRPPFDVRLSTARNEVNRLVAQCEHAPFSQSQMWPTFRSDLESYLQITDDSRSYSLEGFNSFTRVGHDLDAILTDTLREEEQIRQQSEAMQAAAARSIRFWTGLALLAGFLIALGTIIEIQRRYRQLRGTMKDARREREFSNQMLEGMVSAVAAIDARGHIRSANPAFFQMFPGASIGVTIYEKFASEESMKMLESAISSRVDQATYRGRWIRPDNEDQEARTFDVYSSPLEIDGERGQILTLVDVTEATEAEANVRRSEALAAVGQATAQLAHEIKNPLGSVRLGVAMLRDNSSNPQDLNTISLVERGINHLNKLVVDVSEFSRERPLERGPVDLQELVESSVELVTDRVEDKDTPLEFAYAKESIQGQWDADQLREVFMNL
ncbi:MAG: two-component system, NtrC family, sensor histidine kinase PilS, partial [Blastocatellia bacterium]|nr:two-component system, NtrC family, sensor histidine kinase PilS [Blastocatellia bacterium]